MRIIIRIIQISFFLLFINISYSQIGTNITPRLSYKAIKLNNQAANVSSEAIHIASPSAPNQDYCLKLRVFKVNRSDGSGGLADSSIQDSMEDIDGFGDITFLWDGDIEDFNSDNLFNSEVVLIGNEILYNFQYAPDNPNSIDLYFFNKNMIQGASVADGIADGTRIILSRDNRSKGAIYHEIGHILGLFHTYHGTLGNGNLNGENKDGYDNNQAGSHRPLVECVNDYNGAIAGDFVADTPADPGSSVSCEDECLTQVEPGFTELPEGSQGPDCLSGLMFANPDVTNYMRAPDQATAANCGISCFNHFTAGQKNRMKYFLANVTGSFPHLNSLLVDCPVPPDPCDDCSGSQSSVDLIIANTTNDPNDCERINITPPALGNVCDEIRVYWDVDNYPSEYEVISYGDNVAPHFYEDNGDYKVRVAIYRNDTFCSSSETVKTISCNIPPNCENCFNTIVEIVNNATAYTPDCENVTITINTPFEQCYTVYTRPIEPRYQLFEGPNVVPMNVIGGWTINTLSDSVSLIGYLYDENGDYCFKASNSLSLNMDCFTSMEEDDSSSSLNEAFIYPNPFKNSFKIEGNKANIYRVKIFDINGSLLEDTTNLEQLGKNLPKEGLYFVKILFKDGNSKNLSIVHKK